MGNCLKSTKKILKYEYKSEMKIERKSSYALGYHDLDINIKYEPILKIAMKKESYSVDRFTNNIIIFKSINNIFYLIYSNYNKDIISYNLNTNQKLNVIHRAHQDFIYSFQHISDNKNKRDLLLSTEGKK